MNNHELLTQYGLDMLHTKHASTTTHCFMLLRYSGMIDISNQDLFWLDTISSDLFTVPFHEAKNYEYDREHFVLGFLFTMEIYKDLFGDL